jgi:2-polyprenyl-3-methyl-5-hydroxy-6-metoxy-1,4-benzoquinol methylase
MNFYRLESDSVLKNYGAVANVDDPQEWGGDGPQRDIDPSWIQRYKYEAEIIASVINENKFKKILELGSGPGTLAQEIQRICPNVEYHMIDRINAKKKFEDRGFKGKFMVKDLSQSFDVSGVDTDFDYIIINDFLEHITNPSLILKTCYSLTVEQANLFVSVPNWRMGHNFIYRGVFDYDNYIYFSSVHGWGVDSVYPSPLQCQSLPKLSSESCMDDSLITSWNWYFNAKKIQ